MPPRGQHLSSQWNSQLSHPAAVAGRDIDNISPVVNHFAPEQQVILRCLAVTSASISVLSAFIALYWFIMMRTTFRHHLIGIRVVSDLFMSSWYFIFPVVVFSHGAVKDASDFCQASGFFVALGIEASDFATLIIAVHTALYVFRSPNSVRGAGLYPYRYIAFGSWAAFSLFTASLAFLNHVEPYVSQGTYCYLPVRPFWYRLALAWVPRYLIFVTILSIYIAIYMYVKYKFKGVHVTLGATDLAPQTTFPLTEVDQSPRSDSLVEKQVTPSTPVLAAHGLIGSTEELESTNNQASTDATNPFTPTTSPGNSTSEEATNTATPVWVNYTFGASATALPLPPRGGTPPLEMPGPLMGDVTSEASNGRSSELRCRPSRPSVGLRRVVGLVQALGESRRVSNPAPLADDPRRDSDPQTLSSKGNEPINLVDSNGSNPVTQSLRLQHIAIRRQMRYMFIYPAVYMLMWLIPFLGHCLNYSDHFWRNPVFTIQCCVVIVIPLQCAVDCWLFAYREKPWQYIRGSEGTFWNSFAFWTHGRHGKAGRMPPVREVGDQCPGKSEREMSADSRLAYQRRDDEIARMTALRMTRAEDPGSKQSSSAVNGRGNDVNWWEEEARRRQDSVWMWTEGSGEPVWSKRERVSTVSTIEEENEDSEQ